MTVQSLKINGVRAATLTGGRQGPPGIGMDIRTEYVNPNQYIARAPVGSADSASVWKITKIVIATNGTVTTTLARNVSWTGRAGHFYA